jgi:hypothetical protein
MPLAWSTHRGSPRARFREGATVGQSPAPRNARRELWFRQRWICAKSATGRSTPAHDRLPIAYCLYWRLPRGRTRRVWPRCYAAAFFLGCTAAV